MIKTVRTSKIDPFISLVNVISTRFVDPPFFIFFNSLLLCDVFIINRVEQLQTLPKTQSEIDISLFLKTQKPSILYSNTLNRVPMQGRIQDFKLGGGALKKNASSGGRRENFGVFRVKNHDYTPTNYIFSNFRGGGGAPAPPLRSVHALPCISYCNLKIPHRENYPLKDALSISVGVGLKNFHQYPALYNHSYISIHISC
jgi:hypothetical protein